MINWTTDNTVLTFMPNRTYVFDPDTSCAGCNDKNDTFVTVNIPLLVSSTKRCGNRSDPEPFDTIMDNG